ncbi:elongation factor P [Chlamydia pecorum]|uniref:Elongation factor P n=3 Tax=Chlamydia pecorum TaxID=85991 RepID=B5LMU2_CHLPE|nr:elongation factor P [Chlamydia pecorum]ACH42163.1 translation elongation factor P [Chlamydia pecorum E58]AEB41164.1 translation elongation factor P [Chlamydia pecorum E58]AGW38301.1 elongation factor P [Chlamydia pecorum PV3056/3]AGW39226.1 translation elongation factor P [Chlamydia pecorum W73]AGW40151.1 translation elongation factor P [Chlamydia pecorum P787]
MVRVSTSEFRVGLRVEIDGQPYLILQNEFVKPGKGQAFNRIKVKNFLTGRVIERTFKSGESIETADVRETSMRLLYTDQEGATFMDDESFEQETIFWDKLENVKNWLLEDTIYTLILYNGEVISVEPPIFMELSITETAPGVRGDTASGRVLKPAVTNTGAKIMVPIFIEEGEVVKVDTRNGSYESRVSK